LNKSSDNNNESGENPEINKKKLKKNKKHRNKNKRYHYFTVNNYHLLKIINELNDYTIDIKKCEVNNFLKMGEDIDISPSMNYYDNDNENENIYNLYDINENNNETSDENNDSDSNNKSDSTLDLDEDYEYESESEFNFENGDKNIKNTSKYKKNFKNLILGINHNISFVDHHYNSVKLFIDHFSNKNL
jgi:hypothetical protein